MVHVFLEMTSYFLDIREDISVSEGYSPVLKSFGNASGHSAHSDDLITLLCLATSLSSFSTHRWAMSASISCPINKPGLMTEWEASKSSVVKISIVGSAIPSTSACFVHQPLHNGGIYLYEYLMGSTLLAVMTLAKCSKMKDHA